MEGKDREGFGGAPVEIEFQQDSIPKKIQDSQCEAAREQTRSWLLLEKTTGLKFCVGPGWRLIPWTPGVCIKGEQPDHNKFACMTDGHDDRETNKWPDELQETNNVTFHPVIYLCQQLVHT